MRFCAIVPGLMLFAAVCHAAGAPPLDARLDVKVEPDGKLKAFLMMNNRTDGNLCLLPGRNVVVALDANGGILGHPTDTVLLWPNFIDVVWGLKVSKQEAVLLINDRFDVDFNPYGLSLTHEEAEHFTRATYRLELYDCAELVTLGSKAKLRMTRELEATPSFVKLQAPSPP
jgi:hypothetical protein